MNHVAPDRFRAFSAGSHPALSPHPMTLAVLAEKGYEASSLRSKSWSEFERSAAPFLDLVITVCDNARGETCPLWPGTPVTGHWGIEDPASQPGDGRRLREHFSRALDEIETRIKSLIELPIETLNREDLRRELAHTVVSHGWGLLELRSMRMSLEEIFLHLTTEEDDSERGDD